MIKRYLTVFLSIMLTVAFAQSSAPVADSVAIKKKAAQKDTIDNIKKTVFKELNKAVAPVDDIKQSTLQSIKSNTTSVTPPIEKEKIGGTIKKNVSSGKDTILPEIDTATISNGGQKAADKIGTLKEKKQKKVANELSSDRAKQEAGKVTDEVKKSAEENKQQVNRQVDAEKNKVKSAATELKKPADFDLTVDNNGTQGSSQQLENIEQTLKGMKDFKLDANPVASPQLKAPTVKSPDFSLPQLSKSRRVKQPNKERLKVTDLKNNKEQYKNLLSAKAMKDAAGDNLTDAKTVLSQKYLRKLKDSIGGKKFDSIYTKMSPLLRKQEIGKEDLLAAINNPDLAKMESTHDKLSEGKMKDAMKGEATEQAKNFDPRSGKLPQDVLEKLPPLSGYQIDSKYLKLIDSIRSKKLSEQDLKLMEKKVEGNYKEVLLKKKPTFADKSYFDGILGLLSNENATIVQVAPSWGYHILPLISVGLGPVISVRKENKLINSTIGVRSFAKAELFKQRGYLQVEHQMNGYTIDTKMFQSERGSILAGGGVVAKIYGRAALNLSLLYRINNDKELHLSPWVFRMGISTIGSKTKN